ncbi:hypothetical protein FOA52_010348 [Chlamydomonas sp. UWO 241]|nr:hypothetical protein FOA52_010348 [Chlamydomonas sp. UWO 241]
MAAPRQRNVATGAALIIVLALVLAGSGDARALSASSTACHQGEDSAGTIFRFTCDGALSGYEGVDACVGAMVCYRSYDTSCTGTPNDCPAAMPLAPANNLTNGGGGGGGGNGADISYIGIPQEPSSSCLHRLVATLTLLFPLLLASSPGSPSQARAPCAEHTMHHEQKTSNSPTDLLVASPSTGMLVRAPQKMSRSCHEGTDFAEKMVSSCHEGEDGAAAIFFFTCDGALSGYQGVDLCDGAMVCYHSYDTSCIGTPRACPAIPVGADGQDDPNITEVAVYFVQTASHGKIVATVHEGGNVSLVIRLEGLSDVTNCKIVATVHEGGNVSLVIRLEGLSDVTNCKIVATVHEGGNVSLVIWLEGLSDVTNWFTDAPTYKAGFMPSKDWVDFYLNNLFNATTPLNVAVVFQNPYTKDSDDQVVTVSISAGARVRDNVVEYTATLLGDGDPDGSTAKLLANMRSGAKTEFPMHRPTMMLDGIQYLSPGDKIAYPTGGR